MADIYIPTFQARRLKDSDIWDIERSDYRHVPRSLVFSEEEALRRVRLYNSSTYRMLFRVSGVAGRACGFVQHFISSLYDDCSAPVRAAKATIKVFWECAQMNRKSAAVDAHNNRVKRTAR